MASNPIFEKWHDTQFKFVKQSADELFPKDKFDDEHRIYFMLRAAFEAGADEQKRRIMEGISLTEL